MFRTGMIGIGSVFSLTNSEQCLLTMLAVVYQVGGDTIVLSDSANLMQYMAPRWTWNASDASHYANAVLDCLFMVSTRDSMITALTDVIRSCGCLHL